MDHRLRRLEWSPKRNPKEGAVSQSGRGASLSMKEATVLAEQEWSVKQRIEVPWTTVYGAASPGAQFAYLLIEAHDTANPPFDSSIWVRAKEGAPEIRVIHAKYEYNDEEIHQVVPVFVPLHMGAFDYMVQGGFKEGYTISLIGEIA